MMKDYLEPYLAKLSHEKQYSAHTLESYCRDLSYLSELLAETPLEQVKNLDIRRFIATLHGKGLGGRSLGRLLSAWRGFFAYLVAHHGFADNPCIGVRPPKFAKKLPAALSPDVATHLVDLPNDVPQDKRDKAMFELLYSSGLRLSELVGLDIAQLDLNAAEVRVLGKGNKERILPIGSFALAALQDWLQVRAQMANADETAVFVGARGQRISPRVVQLQMKQWGIRQGITQNVHPHVLRHSFASHLLQSSGDLRAVQELLGHENISTTQVYTHLDFQHLNKIYDAAHPRAKKKS